MSKEKLEVSNGSISELLRQFIENYNKVKEKYWDFFNILKIRSLSLNNNTYVTDYLVTIQ